MTPPGDTARHLALALDAFPAEHRGCWRVDGKGLEGGQDDARYWLESLNCGSVMILSWR